MMAGWLLLEACFAGALLFWRLGGRYFGLYVPSLGNVYTLVGSNISWWFGGAKVTSHKKLN